MRNSVLKFGSRFFPEKDNHFVQFLKWCDTFRDTPLLWKFVFSSDEGLLDKVEIWILSAFAWNSALFWRPKDALFTLMSDGNSFRYFDKTSERRDARLGQLYRRLRRTIEQKVYTYVT